MVAEVTLNRVSSPDFPNTVCEVVWQPGAFSWTRDGKSDDPKNFKAFAESVVVASEVLHDSSILLGTEATFYHEKSIYPYWADSLTKLGMIGDHIFYSKKDS